MIAESIAPRLDLALVRAVRMRDAPADFEELRRRLVHLSLLRAPSWRTSAKSV
jgi:hypothetical protein